MESKKSMNERNMRIMAWGVGSYTQGMLHILKQHGADVCTYLTRDYAHYSPSLEGKTFHKEIYPNPCKLIKEMGIDFVIPMSIDWMMENWVDEFLSMDVPIFSPTLEGMKIERERNFSRVLCKKFNIPFPRAFVAGNG